MPDTRQSSSHLEGFEKDNATQVFCSTGVPTLHYTDGLEPETRILRILQRVHDRGLFSQELIDHISDWPTEYHFSPRRHNLLRHVSFRESDTILELGAGCGAITRQLGETGAQVLAIEGSFFRAQCAAQRCVDLENVNVYCADFRYVRPSPRFDYVTMIGVLEYAPLYFPGAHPVVECLKAAARFLRPGGLLVLAIENQLGTKYLCGFPEDHLGIPYFGLENRYSSKTPRTFGFSDLTNQLYQAGFLFARFEFPFPDYKLPDIVFCDNAFRREDFFPVDMIRQTRSRIYGTERFIRTNIDEKLFWQVIAANGLEREFSNSFLVFASQKLKTSVVEEKTLLAVKYTVNRHFAYNTKTRFLVDADDRIIVQKQRLCDQEPLDPAVPLTYIYTDEDYVAGSLLDTEISAAISYQDIDRVLLLLRLWIRFLKEHGCEKLDLYRFEHSHMRQDFIDCTPKNLVMTRTGLEYIDREWAFPGPIKLGSLMLRYLIDFSREHRFFLCQELPGRGGPLQRLLSALGLAIDGELVKGHSAIAGEINSVVYPWKVSRSRRKMINGELSARPVCTGSLRRWSIRLMGCFERSKGRLRRAICHMRAAVRALLFGNECDGR